MIFLEPGPDKESTLRHVLIDLDHHPSGTQRTSVITGSKLYHQKRQNLIGPSEK